MLFAFEKLRVFFISVVCVFKPLRVLRKIKWFVFEKLRVFFISVVCIYKPLRALRKIK